MSDEMSLGEAFRRQYERADASERVNRKGWTNAQWVADAERLMNEPDGAVTSLLNGHAMALISAIRKRDERIAELMRVVESLTTPFPQTDAEYGNCVLCGESPRTYSFDPKPFEKQHTADCPYLIAAEVLRKQE